MAYAFSVVSPFVLREPLHWLQQTRAAGPTAGPVDLPVATPLWHVLRGGATSAVVATAENLRNSGAAARAEGKRGKETAESFARNKAAASTVQRGAHAYPAKAIALPGP